jgi:hypothetical protein
MPFLDGYVAALEPRQEGIGPLKDRSPESRDSWIQIINHDLINVLIDKEAQADASTARKWLDVSARAKRLTIQ